MSMQPGVPDDVSRQADRNVKAEGDRVGHGEFDLVDVAAGSENAEVRDDSAARADEVNRY